MLALVRTPAAAVWLILVGATVLSWTLGIEHGFDAGAQRLASVVILLVAFVKVRFIALYFMELREAPWALRGAVEAYCVVVGALVVGMFLLG